MNTPLQKAAQAMIDRWDSTDWKDTPHTAHYIEELRKALAAEIAQSVEPVLYQSRMRPTWVVHGTGWFAWESCSKDAASDYVKTPLLHEWEYEVRTLYLHPPQPQATTPAVPKGYVLVAVGDLKELHSSINGNNYLGEAWEKKCISSMIAAAQGEKP